MIKRALQTAVFISVIFSLDSAWSQDQVVTIGHVAPLTGPSAHMGKDTEDGARFAIEQLNAKGVVIGGKKVRLVLMGEDDGGDPKLATNIAEKLVDARVNGVIGHMNSGTTIPASKIYHDAGIPEISPSATNPGYTHQGFDTAFRMVANDRQLGSALGRYAVQVSGARKIAVVDDRTAYGQGVADEFVKGALANTPKPDIVAREYTTAVATDFSTILTRIKSKKPDVLFFGGMDVVGGPMLRQARQLGLEARFMGGDGICSSELTQLAGPSLGEAQVVCAEAGGIEERYQTALATFKEVFEKRFGHPVILNAPYAYDAVMVMVRAMQDAGSADPRKYLPVLAKIHTTGVTGDIAFDANGDLVNGTVTLYTFKRGQRTAISVSK